MQASKAAPVAKPHPKHPQATSKTPFDKAQTTSKTPCTCIKPHQKHPTSKEVV